MTDKDDHCIPYLNTITGENEIIPLINPLNITTIGQLIRERRATRGLSLDKSASDAGVSRSSYFRVENGNQNIRYKTMMDVFHCMRFSFYIEGIVSDLPSIFDVGQLIHTVRKSKNLSLRELSELSGVSHVKLFDIEQCASQFTANGEIGYEIILNVLNALDIRSCVIQMDEYPVVFEDIQSYNARYMSGHPMYKSPYLS